MEGGSGFSQSAPGDDALQELRNDFAQTIAVKSLFITEHLPCPVRQELHVSRVFAAPRSTPELDETWKNQRLAGFSA